MLTGDTAACDAQVVQKPTAGLQRSAEANGEWNWICCGHPNRTNTLSNPDCNPRGNSVSGFFSCFQFRVSSFSFSLMSMASLAGWSPQGNLTQSGPGFPSILSVVLSWESRTRQLLVSAFLFCSILLHSLPVLIPATLLPIDTNALFAFQQTQRKSHHLMSSLSFPGSKFYFFHLSFCLFLTFFLLLSHSLSASLTL